jgi:hypothetical protein
MNPIAIALKNKLGQAGSYLSGTRTINNATDPTSALNQSKKKALQKNTERSFRPKPVSNGIGVGM